jgi:DNA adenine methylase
MSAPLLSWLGGKVKLADRIISLMPSHKKYMEPFFGGGSVFFKKVSAEQSYINDINSSLTNLYETVRDRQYELMRLITLTVRSEDQYKKFQELFENPDEYNKLDANRKALVYYYLIKNSFNSNTANNYGLNPNSNWQSEGMFETIISVNQKLRNTVITNRDWKTLIQYADQDTVMYLDPPYAITLSSAGDRYYQYLLTEDEHLELRDTMVAMKNNFKWIISYDVHPFVDKLYDGIEGVYKYTTEQIFQSSINKHERFVSDETYATAFKSEYLIVNFDINYSLPLFNQ